MPDLFDLDTSGKRSFLSIVPLEANAVFLVRDAVGSDWGVMAEISSLIILT